MERIRKSNKIVNSEPYLIESVDLAAKLGSENLLVIDLGSLEEYQNCHVPGAIHLDYRKLRSETKPAAGLLPPLADIVSALQRAGISENHYVVAYDHGNNAAACRLLWTLALIGHTSYSLLDGGMTAWSNDGHITETRMVNAKPSKLNITLDDSVIADKSYVLASLNNPDIQILDARSPEEYRGMKSASDRKGRIPGAISLNWLDTIDFENQNRLLSKTHLLRMLEERGFRKDREIIVHCQTHQRSSHSFVMLKHLGFPRVRGYAGSWSEWAADESLPVENG